MEYVGVNEQYEAWKGTWQDSKFMAELNERQRERDFREGYMRGFEIATKVEQNKSTIIALEGLSKEVLNDMRKEVELSRVEVIQHSPPYNGRAYTNYAAKEVEVQYQDGGKTLKVFCK